MVSEKNTIQDVLNSESPLILDTQQEGSSNWYFDNEDFDENSFEHEFCYITCFFCTLNSPLTPSAMIFFLGPVSHNKEWY